MNPKETEVIQEISVSLSPIMATKRIVNDPDFGLIIIRTHRLARNITMRTKDDGLHVTVPPRCTTTKVLEVVELHRAPLLEKWQRNIPQPLQPGFQINAPCFRLRVEQGGWKFFTVKVTDEGIVILCPEGADFTQSSVQDLLKEAIIRALKKSAKGYLPPLLDELAAHYGLTYHQVKITGSRSRWGSCSAKGTINLSCYLMLLPPHLMDYVLLHELAHTRQMNHGPLFWELLDSMTEGRARSLRKELRNYKTGF